MFSQFDVISTELKSCRWRLLCGHKQKFSSHITQAQLKEGCGNRGRDAEKGRWQGAGLARLSLKSGHLSCMRWHKLFLGGWYNSSAEWAEQREGWGSRMGAALTAALGMPRRKEERSCLDAVLAQMDPLTTAAVLKFVYVSESPGNTQQLLDHTSHNVCRISEGGLVFPEAPQEVPVGITCLGTTGLCCSHTLFISTKLMNLNHQCQSFSPVLLPSPFDLEPEKKSIYIHCIMWIYCVVLKRPFRKV